ncbi:MAG: hypothetical protein CME26_07095 [Gemmatimonadetes bacterium]|nr:hypothetical protein [Gemmatimonadota bacterium]
MTKMTLTILAFLAVVSCTWAQAPLPIRADAGSFFHELTLVDADSTRTRYRQAVSPVQVSTPIWRGTLTVSSAFMYVEQEVNEVSADAWGLLDTEVSGDWTLPFAKLTGFAVLPTGKNRLNGADSTLVSAFYRNDLNFPVRAFGEGFDYGGAITVAHQRGHLGGSIGFAYTARGAYEPFDSVGEYHPGDEATFAGGLNYAQSSWTMNVDVAGTFLFTDRLDGLVVFQNGKQVVTRAGFHYENPGVSLSLEATEIFRFKDRRLSLTGPSTGLLLFGNRNRNDFRASAHLSWNPLPALCVFGAADLKTISDTADVDGNVIEPSGRVYGYGGGLTLQIGATEHLDLGVTRFDGWVEDGARDLEGWNLRINFRLLF